jgi:hypothetical protein
MEETEDKDRDNNEPGCSCKPFTTNKPNFHAMLPLLTLIYFAFFPHLRATISRVHAVGDFMLAGANDSVLIATEEEFARCAIVVFTIFRALSCNNCIP